MTVELDLRACDPGLLEQAKANFAEGNGIGFVGCAPSQSALALVFDNVFQLKDRGIYEESLLSAFSGARHNHREWAEEIIDWLFDKADRAKLKAAGDALPGTGPFRIYRGVAGMGQHRRLRGYSWTSSLEVACWFATRFNLRSPAVLMAIVEEKDLLAYTDGSSEQEFICKPSQTSRLKMTTSEILEGAKRQVERARALEQARMAALEKAMAESNGGEIDIMRILRMK
jgi:hypothetical protein